ncbi:unnamed protein product [Trifolium pratense]|uniref:Uncharacterized protein n=1 Tax=Trifolium pratense TaxID=57577 RepID=A0ACB0I6F9_TRIPR|nr:unnamed protein product [Trifolium pratense]
MLIRDVKEDIIQVLIPPDAVKKSHADLVQLRQINTLIVMAAGLFDETSSQDFEDNYQPKIDLLKVVAVFTSAATGTVAINHSCVAANQDLAMALLFVIGYASIIFEESLALNKSGVGLLMAEAYGIKERHQPNQKEALNSCDDRYRAILVAGVPKYVSALKQGDPKFAEDGANDATIEATTCENDFKGKSPLSDKSCFNPLSSQSFG